MPGDHLAAVRLEPDSPYEILGPEIPDNLMGVDIGPETRKRYKGLLEDADVQVTVRDGEATLAGVVTNLPLSREIEKQARKETKVVHNQVRVFIEEPVADKEIVEGVRKAILGYPYYQVFDYVEFGVDQGNVLLVGSVVQPWKKRIIEDRVARVDGVRAGLFAGRDDILDHQVAFGRRRRTDAHRLVRLFGMQRVFVGIRVHRNGGDPHFSRSSKHPAGDLATIGYQNLIEHACYPTPVFTAGYSRAYARGFPVSCFSALPGSGRF